jgi:hypothetical protein
MEARSIISLACFDKLTIRVAMMLPTLPNDARDGETPR